MWCLPLRGNWESEFESDASIEEPFSVGTYRVRVAWTPRSVMSKLNQCLWCILFMEDFFLRETTAGHSRHLFMFAPILPRCCEQLFLSRQAAYIQRFTLLLLEQADCAVVSDAASFSVMKTKPHKNKEIISQILNCGKEIGLLLWCAPVIFFWKSKLGIRNIWRLYWFEWIEGCFYGLNAYETIRPNNN